MSTASPRDIIADAIRTPTTRDPAECAIRALTAAGYRVVREGELDAATEALRQERDELKAKLAIAEDDYAAAIDRWHADALMRAE